MPLFLLLQAEIEALKARYQEAVEEATAAADYEVVEARQQVTKLNTEINLLADKWKALELLQETNLERILEACPTTISEQLQLATRASGLLAQAMAKVGELMVSGAQMVECNLCGEGKLLHTEMPCCGVRLCKACYRRLGQQPCPYCRATPMPAE